MYKKLNDKVVKQIFTNESGIIKEYVVRIIASIFKIDVDKVRNGIKLITPEIESSIDTVKSTADIVYENDDNYFNIEINANGSKLLYIKNSVYLYNLIVRQVHNSKDYNNIKPIVQINLNNYDLFDMNELIYTSKIMEVNNNIVRDENLIIIDISLPILEKMNYNEIKKKNDYDLEKLLYILVCNDNDKLNNLYGDGFMEKVKEQLDAYTRAIDSHLCYDHEEFEEMLREERLENAKNEAYEQGQKSNLITIFNNLLKNNLDKETIKKYLNLTDKDYEDLLKEVTK